MVAMVTGSVSPSNQQEEKPAAAVVDEGKRKKPLSGYVSGDDLKELLMLQLDMIERQQKRLAMKDKQIINLKVQKDQLEARLRRMERRLAIQKRYHSDNDDMVRPKSLSLRHSKPTQPLFMSATPKSSGAKSTPSVVTVSSRQDKLFAYRSYLNTDLAYLDPPVNRLLSREQLDNSRKTEMQEVQISVPPWHLVEHKANTLGAEDEDVSDEVFMKRHIKPEVEEVKRKRWDLQHMRQLRQHQLLEQKYGERQNKQDTNQSKEPLVALDTLYRDPEHAMAIKIGDVIPVCVFGYQVPNVYRSQLKLPWFSIARREVQLRESREKSLKKQKLKKT